ncbi:glycosyltransferase [Sinomicrobium kalidii]|uniref:glycosyltransferase n=1 Tax=Sinomicrobium kalidii TaxID=2900738 RepID=UPI001E3865FA|nr:glycosyltransferase [Sinomicrobium kalidii]UGU14377.1 glycosyltransferase [Sinomicrobium kalidii]
MKKLLQINSVANMGSTGRIAMEIGQIAINRGWESYIACGRKREGGKSNIIEIGVKTDRLLHGVKSRLFDAHGFGSKNATRTLIKKIKEINPDVIALHNIHGYYVNIKILFDYLKECNKPIFWTLYDCWAFTGHCAYFDMVGCSNWKDTCKNCPCKNSYPKSWVNNSHANFKAKKDIFTNVKDLQLIVHSNWLKSNVRQSFLCDYPINLIRNGINLSNFHYKPSKIREKYGLEKKFIILGIANKWSERKGFSDIKLLSDFLQPDEVVLVDGLNVEQQKNLPENIISYGKAKDVSELAELYSAADVFYNPTYEDNFPTTNLEALACGTPVITYNTGGSPEAIDENTGFVAEKGSLDQVRNYITQLKKANKANYREMCTQRAHQLFNYKERYEEYVSLFQQTIN